MLRNPPRTTPSLAFQPHPPQRNANDHRQPKPQLQSPTTNTTRRTSYPQNQQLQNANHPGSTVGNATPEESIRHIADSLNAAHEETEGILTVLEIVAPTRGTPYSHLVSLLYAPFDAPFRPPMYYAPAVTASRAVPPLTLYARYADTPSYTFPPALTTTPIHAGAGNVIGSSFAQIAAIIALVEDKTRVETI
ncbi:hypothetical protein D9611_014284 [Ephemerocybe angulata]|uniref:Uncharacterized protein n=1 Tax=Ephemerocybe angulata TaxID=980116 RepID=A0A8H5BTR5_9AGAR|nr:hypothetical protein D9611_014284 [Tulosesus angulatus]